MGFVLLLQIHPIVAPDLGLDFYYLSSLSAILQLYHDYHRDTVWSSETPCRRYRCLEILTLKGCTMVPPKYVSSVGLRINSTWSWNTPSPTHSEKFIAIKPWHTVITYLSVNFIVQSEHCIYWRHCFNWPFLDITHTRLCPYSQV